MRMTGEVRERRMCAWRALGGGVGVREWDVKTWSPPADELKGGVAEKEGVAERTS